ncbi:ParB N-terminal domain-containing protein [Phaeobacter marinintestinus]|uniref:ParB N-terminal domain-containing protein n=1 Tax=Falsiphaeobacter marinintestinus TaxID=1492905 RepID=UPI0011B51118|nr:ParB N-terminal domain-containing protein [Phaeobacter marinintestinus]
MIQPKQLERARRCRIRAVKNAKTRHPEMTMMAPSELVPYDDNAREHSPGQIAQIKSSLEAFWFMNPILVGACNEVIVGHGKLIAATELGLRHVPVIQTTHL